MDHEKAIRPLKKKISLIYIFIDLFIYNWQRWEAGEGEINNPVIYTEKIISFVICAGPLLVTSNFGDNSRFSKARLHFPENMSACQNYCPSEKASKSMLEGYFMMQNASTAFIYQRFTKRFRSVTK